MKDKFNKPTGRPRLDEEREVLTIVSFKADAETLRQLKELEKQAKQGDRVVKPRSMIIRRAIAELAEMAKKTPLWGPKE